MKESRWVDKTALKLADKMANNLAVLKAARWDLQLVLMMVVPRGKKMVEMMAESKVALLVLC